MTGTPKPRSSKRTALRRLGIGIFLGLPVVGIAAVLPMRGAFGQAVPASASSSPGQAVLNISQTDSSDPVTEGDNVTYTMTVGNDGGSSGDATNVTLFANPSPDVDLVSATPSQGECFPPEGTFQCNLGTISPGNTATVALVVTTTDRCSGSGSFRPTGPFALSEPCTIYNDFHASSPGAIEPEPSEEPTTVNPATGAHLTLGKSASPDPVQELNPITYTLDVANNGIASASDVTVTDTLPAGEVFDSASATQGSCTHNGAAVTCHLGTLDFQTEGPGGTATVTILAQAPNVTADTIVTNAADVTASNAPSAHATTDTTVLVNAGGSTQGEVPPGTTVPLTFTTSTQAKGNGAPAVNGGDQSAVSLTVPPGGPGGSISLDELLCTTAPCTGAGPQPTTSVVLGNVAFDITPPADYPSNKPFRVTLLYDRTLHPKDGPTFYFKQGVTAHEIKLQPCGTPGARGKAPCVVVSKQIVSGNALINGDWKIIVKINSDPRMHR
jgi:uncharacterized repeat protein (TIGR01451 family)